MKKLRVIIPALAAAAGAAYLCLENLTFGVTSLEFAAPRLPEEFDGFTVALVSDVHDTRCVRALSSALAARRPDMVAVAGDLLDSYHPREEAALELCVRALGVCPVYYVPGNHEARLRGTLYPGFARRLSGAGVTVLHGGSAIIRRGAASLRVLGLADPAFSPGNPLFSPEELPPLSPEDPFTLLLCHRPERFSEYCAAGVDLALCGHAHGGQVRLPFLGPLFAPNQGLLPRYTSGLYVSGGTAMAVSRGLGNSGLRLRVNNRPELVLLRLTRAR